MRLRFRDFIYSNNIIHSGPVVLRMQLVQYLTTHAPDTGCCSDKYNTTYMNFTPRHEAQPMNLTRCLVYRHNLSLGDWCSNLWSWNRRHRRYMCYDFATAAATAAADLPST
jgi:hypothetical protein